MGYVSVDSPTGSETFLHTIQMIDFNHDPQEEEGVGKVTELWVPAMFRMAWTQVLI